MTLLAGCLCMEFLWKPLGALFALGAIAKFINDTITYCMVEDRLRHMTDAKIENELNRREPEREHSASERLLADLKKALHETAAN